MNTKRILSAAVLTTLLGAGPALLAQETKAPADSKAKSHTETTTKATSPDGSSKIKTETVVGTVKAYEAGKKRRPMWWLRRNGGCWTWCRPAASFPWPTPPSSCKCRATS